MLQPGFDDPDAPYRPDRRRRREVHGRAFAPGAVLADPLRPSHRAISLADAPSKGRAARLLPPLIEPPRMTIASILQKARLRDGVDRQVALGLSGRPRTAARPRTLIDRAQPGKTDETRQWASISAKADRRRPDPLGFDYFFGNAGCPTTIRPTVFIENDRPVAVPTRMSSEEWRGLPGFVPGPMADDWSEEESISSSRQGLGRPSTATFSRSPTILSSSSSLPIPPNPCLLPECNERKEQGRAARRPGRCCRLGRRAGR